MKSDQFFKIFRRQGAFATLRVLGSFRDFKTTQASLLQRLREEGFNNNLFYRIHRDLLHHRIIAYRLDRHQNRIIEFTEKGQEIWKKMQELEALFHPSKS
jgi:predicted transcriptional regulator